MEENTRPPTDSAIHPNRNIGGGKKEDLLPTRVTRMNFVGWGDAGKSIALTPDGENGDSWTDPVTCHMPDNAKWTGGTWFFEKGVIVAYSSPSVMIH